MHTGFKTLTSLAAVGFGALALVAAQPAMAAAVYGGAAVSQDAGGHGGENGTTSLRVTVTDIANHDGTMRIALFRGQLAYDGRDSLAGAGAVVAADEVSVVFSDLEPGEYAIMLYHDVNDSGKMDTNFLGIPKEPYAFSNNAPGRYGPPDYERAAFAVVAGDNSHVIALGS